MPKSRNNKLFSSTVSLSQALADREHQCRERVRKLDISELKREDIVNTLEREFRVTPAAIHVDKKSFPSPTEDMVLPWHPSRLHVPGVGVPGYRGVARVPFDGDAWLFEHRPPKTSVVGFIELPIDANVSDGAIVIPYECPKDCGEELNARIDGELNRIAAKLDQQRPEIDGFSARIKDLVEKAVSVRRKQLDDMDSFINALNG